MLRVADQQISLWDAVLAPEMVRLPDELARIDAYLDDERFIAPWRGMFDARLGRGVGAGRYAVATAVSRAPLPVRIRDAVPWGG